LQDPHDTPMSQGTTRRRSGVVVRVPSVGR